MQAHPTSRSSDESSGNTSAVIRTLASISASSSNVSPAKILPVNDIDDAHNAYNQSLFSGDRGECKSTHATAMDGHNKEHPLNDALRLDSSNATRITMNQRLAMLNQLFSAHTSRAERQTDECSSINCNCSTTIKEKLDNSGTVTRPTFQNGRRMKQWNYGRGRRVGQETSS